MTAVQPYFAVVSANDAAARCGSSESIGLLNSMYQVARLQPGQVLKVDGEAQGWARTTYPVGACVFIPSDCAQLDPATHTVTLVKPTRPKAPNMVLGLKGSWKDALEQPLAAGMKLTLVENEPAADGRGNTAFKCAAPETARCFVPSNALRKASQEEVNAFMAAGGAAMSNPRPQASAPQGANQGTFAPGAGAGAPAAAPTTTAQAPVQAAPIEIKPLQIRPSQFERLESAFESVKKQPAESAEYTELLAEFRKALDKIKPEDTGAKMNRARLQQRIDFLTLKADMQAKQRELAATSSEFTQDEKRLAEKMAEVDRVRQYTIVGRLSGSTIYDGKRLPLMFRVQSVGGAAPRTLAYVRPDEALGIDSKLGQVVGVVGEPVMDPALKLNIITPTRIDILEAVQKEAPAGEATKEPGEATEPQPAPKPAREKDYNK